MCPSTAGEPLATRSMLRSWPKATTPSATRSSSTTAGTALDASLLLIPIFGFLPADDPRVLGTIDAVKQEICDGPFVWRYSTKDGVDGLAGGEGAFLICCVWLVSALAMDGRVEEAERNLEQLTALRNDVGLFSEEYNPRANACWATSRRRSRTSECCTPSTPSGKQASRDGLPSSGVTCRSTVVSRWQSSSAASAVE